MPGRGYWHDDVVAWASALDPQPRLRVYQDAASYLAHEDAVTTGCVVADVRQPDAQGPALTKALGQHERGLPLIVMTQRAFVDEAVACMRAGAFDYVECPIGRTRFEAVYASALDVSAKRDELRRSRLEIEQRFDPLSNREREVLELLGDGLGSQAIADALEVSKRTIDYHRSQIMSKVGVASALELVTLFNRAKQLALYERAGLQPE